MRLLTTLLKIEPKVRPGLLGGPAAGVNATTTRVDPKRGWFTSPLLRPEGPPWLQLSPVERGTAYSARASPFDATRPRGNPFCGVTLGMTQVRATGTARVVVTYQESEGHLGGVHTRLPARTAKNMRGDFCE